MITIDTSVGMKWFKIGERFAAEAAELRQRVETRMVSAGAREILSLEIVRGLKNAQVRQPALKIADEEIDSAYDAIESLFRSGALVECSVSKVKSLAKDLQMAFGLFVADALHLASAIANRSQYFVVDDHHFLASDVVSFAAQSGVKIVNLPSLIAALNVAGSGSSSKP